MTTTITENEIKLIYIGAMLSGIIGLFIFFYAQAPIQEVSVPGQTLANNQTANADDAGWITGMVSPGMGLDAYLPNGLDEIIVVSAIFLIPFILMLASAGLRYIKDIVTGWV